MFNDESNANEQMVMMTMESLVPENHLLRKIDKHIDFSFIREITKPYYSDLGRPGIDPVKLFKIPFIKSIFGISSMRQTIKEIEVNAAYRWFIQIPFGEKVPSHSTYSQNYIRRYQNTDVYEQIFENIISQLVERNLLDLKTVHIDSTHVKASANKKRYIKEIVKESKSVYEDEILEEVNRLREKEGKKKLKKKLENKVKEIKTSKTDPDCGWYVKGEKERQFAYSAHIGTDEHGYILDVVTTPGNVHDSQSFKSLYKKIVNRFKNQIDGIAVDSAYKTPAIVNMITGNGQIPFMPYKRPMTKKGFFKTYEFVYDEYYGNVICPNNKTLDYKRLSRDGFYIFEANEADCRTCPLKSKCTEGKNKQYRLSIHHDKMDYVEDIRHTEYGRQCYKNRSKTVERIFGDFKEKHNGRYTHYRGIKKVSNEQLLVFAAMNMKKMAMYLDKIA
jgi:transposase